MTKNIYTLSENEFINNLINDKKIVCIFLMTGIKLIGKIASYDDKTIFIINSKEEVQMIYKQAISTIM
jgi:host factor-I protein